MTFEQIRFRLRNENHCDVGKELFEQSLQLAVRHHSRRGSERLPKTVKKNGQGSALSYAATGPRIPSLVPQSTP